MLGWKQWQDKSPTVIMFTEAHWADEASLALLKHCLPLSDRVLILWMVVYRPDPDAPTWSFNHFVKSECPHRLTNVNLHLLSKSDSNKLLDQLIDVEVLPEEMRSSTNLKAILIILTEIVRSLVEQRSDRKKKDNGR